MTAEPEACATCGAVHDEHEEDIPVRDIPPTSVRLQPRTLAAVGELAKRLGVSRNALIDRAVRQLLATSTTT